MAEKCPLDETVPERLVSALRLERFRREMVARDVERLFPKSGLYAYRKNSQVVRRGEATRDLYIVCSGKVAITRAMGPAAVQLASFGPGEVFGELALMLDGIRAASAIATEDSKVFRVACSDIQSLLKTNPALGEHLTSLMNDRLAA